MKTLDKILIALGVFVGAFIITMIVLFCIYQCVPDTLIVAVLGSGGTECILCALITITKHKKNIPTDADNDNEVMAIEE